MRDEKTWHDSQKENDKDKDEEDGQIQDTCDICVCENITIIPIWQ